MLLENIELRVTTALDLDTIMEVHTKAFGYDKEARLTAALLADQSAEPMLSLLAGYNGQAIGHVLFTRACFADRANPPLMHILAPLAVIPEYQRQGIGGLLIDTGLQKLREMGSQMVFVLGHKEYYPRYGFEPHAMHMGYQPPYPIPEENSEYWMYQALVAETDTFGCGRVVCADTLNRPEHWREDETDR